VAPAPARREEAPRRHQGAARRRPRRRLAHGPMTLGLAGLRGRLAVLTTIQAMGDPTRLAILHLVRGRELAAGDIAARFAVTRPAISQHLRILRTAGLLTERRVGTRRLYAFRPEGLGELRDFIDDFWDVRLRQLKHAAETIERERKRK